MLLAVLVLAALSPSTDGTPPPASATPPPAAGSSDNQPAPPANRQRWLKRPSGDNIASAFPERAQRSGVSGRAELQCDIEHDGGLQNCEVLAEAPQGWGFGEAALKLAPRFLAAPPTLWDASKPPTVKIPIAFVINGVRPPPLVTISTPAADAPADRAGPQIVREPDWLKKPTADDLKGVWPAGALRDGVSGKAVVSCEVNVNGVLEKCRVKSETPADKGFGTAALLLTPSFLMRPAVGPNGPLRSEVNIPINFNNNGSGSHALPDAVFGEFAMMREVDWSAAPTFADLAAAYPKAGGGVRGYVALRCRLTATGAVKDCETTKENPTGKGFDRAARDLIGRFHARLDPGIFKRGEALKVNIPVSFPAPGSVEVQKRRIGEPLWTAGLDPAKAAAVYPYQAAAKGVRTGRGVAECTVQADGSLADCKPLPGDPDGMGFSESAVMVAKIMRMNPWTREGGPVDGADIRIPIRFNLAPAAAATATNQP